MGEPIGSIGAAPVYASPADVPPAMLRHAGLRLAVRLGGDRYQFFEVRHARRGLGFALAAGAAAGSAGGPVGTLVGIGVSLVPVIGKLFGGLFGGGGPSAQERDAANQFEQMAGQVTQLFNRIQSQAAITAADVSAAEQALTQLAQAAAQLQSVEYVQRKWNDPAYRPAYEQRLAQIRQAAQQGGGGAAPNGTGGATAGDDTMLYAAIGALALLWVLK